jgi:hypothetical protein
MDGCVKPAIDHADQFEPVFFIAFPDCRGEYMIFVIKKACPERQADAMFGRIGGILCGVELEQRIICISHSWSMKSHWSNSRAAAFNPHPPTPTPAPPTPSLAQALG